MTNYQKGANAERCQVCGDILEGKDRITIYQGLFPDEVDEDTVHEYFCEDCWETHEEVHIEQNSPDYCMGNWG